MVRQGEVGGHAAVWLENELLRLTILPEKGADIYEFVHKPSGVDLMMRTPAGLQPPGELPPADFLDNYEGAWQELFPNTGDPCEYRGKMLPMHGEVALLPWAYHVEQDDDTATAVRFTVRCAQTPFRLERLMRLNAGESTVEVEGRVTNEGDEAAHFVWGHHVVVGGAFLEGGCIVDAPAGFIETPAEPYESELARLLPGQSSPWPFARGRDPDERIDLRQVPGPEMQSHDDAFLTALAHGEVSVTNLRLGLRFTLNWDARLFRTIILWQPYGGPARMPLQGAYGLGIEPWVAGGNLQHAIARGEALLLAPGEQLTTRLFASVASVS
jgi:galactose mutarotase-like enzyme